jgi:hypothetical protein
MPKPTFVFETVTKRQKDFAKTRAYVKSQIAYLCRGNVRRDYILTDALPEADALITAFEVMPLRGGRQRVQLYGFVILQKEKNDVYMDVMCARGAGKLLLDQVTDLAHRWKKKYVVIAATPFAMPYWMKQGFVNADGACRADKRLDKRVELIKQKKFKTWDDAVDDPLMKKFMGQLVYRNLGANDCEGVAHCSSQGFYMTLCV